MNRIVISAAALATFVSSAAVGCGGQVAQSLDQVATDPVDVVEVWATAPAEPASASESSASGSGNSTGGDTAGDVYSDGTYPGDPIRTRYGYLQVVATIQNGELTDVQFLSYPHRDHESAQTNSRATGVLSQEAIQTQSADVKVVSGATVTSEAFMESLGSALGQALQRGASGRR